MAMAGGAVVPAGTVNSQAATRGAWRSIGDVATGIDVMGRFSGKSFDLQFTIGGNRFFVIDVFAGTPNISKISGGAEALTAEERSSVSVHALHIARDLALSEGREGQQFPGLGAAYGAVQIPPASTPTKAQLPRSSFRIASAAINVNISAVTLAGHVIVSWNPLTRELNISTDSGEAVVTDYFGVKGEPLLSMEVNVVNRLVAELVTADARDFPGLVKARATKRAGKRVTPIAVFEVGEALALWDAESRHLTLEWSEKGPRKTSNFVLAGALADNPDLQVQNSDGSGGLPPSISLAHVLHAANRLLNQIAASQDAALPQDLINACAERVEKQMLSEAAQGREEE